MDGAHFARMDAFGGWVVVRARANEPGALFATLEAVHYYGMRSPLIHDIAWEAEEVEITCTAAASVMVLDCGSPAALEAGGFASIGVADVAGRRAKSNPVTLASETP